MKTFEQKLVWYDASEKKPRKNEIVLISVGTKDEYSVCFGYYDPTDGHWYHDDNVDYNTLNDPNIHVWSWAKLPKGVKLVQ